MTQLPHFNGADYQPARDDERLGAQLQRVWNAMRDHQPHTLAELEATTGDPPASISAQLRHLRKERFGGHTIVRAYLGDGLYSYRLIEATTQLPDYLQGELF